MRPGPGPAPRPCGGCCARTTAAARRSGERTTYVRATLHLYERPSFLRRNRYTDHLMNKLSSLAARIVSVVAAFGVCRAGGRRWRGAAGAAPGAAAGQGARGGGGGGRGVVPLGDGAASTATVRIRFRVVVVTKNVVRPWGSRFSRTAICWSPSATRSRPVNRDAFA